VSEAGGEPSVFAIRSELDIVQARQAGRQLAAEVGFKGTDLVLVATAISELARNIVEYAQRGEILLSVVQKEGRRGVRIVARDEGPGIPDIELAMRDGYSSSHSLGMGLPGARRLVDDFTIQSEVGKGTVVTATKFVPR
jgi:serine/threonine-protein kinase RsbT